MAITFDSIEDQFTFFVNEAFGLAESPYGYGKNLTSYDWINSVFKGSVYVGSETPTYDSDSSFDGSISCLQFFDYALDSPTMSLKKYCQDLPEDKSVSPCPPGYDFYDDWCYEISEIPQIFSAAEMSCLPEKDDPYESQLMYSDNPRHWAHVAKLVQKKLEDADDFNMVFWAGFSDRAEDGFATTSFGDNITLETSDIITSGLKCGLAGMYLST